MEIQNALCELIVHDILHMYKEYQKNGYKGTRSYGYAKTRFECQTPLGHACAMTAMDLDIFPFLSYIRNIDASYAIRICPDTISISETQDNTRILELESSKVLDEEYLFQKSLIHDISAFNVTFFKLLLNLCDTIHQDYKIYGANDD